MFGINTQEAALPLGMLTVTEVASLLHIHPNTVRIWSDAGLLKAYRLGYRGDRRFSLQDIETFLKAYNPYKT